MTPQAVPGGFAVAVQRAGASTRSWVRSLLVAECGFRDPLVAWFGLVSGSSCLDAAGPSGSKDLETLVPSIL